MDNRIRELAKLLVNYSIALKPKEKVLIEATGTRSFPLVEALIGECYAVGGIPFYLLHDSLVERAMLQDASECQFNREAAYQFARMKDMQCYVGVDGSDNVLELSGIPDKKLKIVSSTVFKKVHDFRVRKTRWVVCEVPGSAFAQAAKMSTHDFEDFFFNACLAVDYPAMSKAMNPLVKLLNKTKAVRVCGQGTDLNFFIAGIPADKCAGQYNMPDGEVFTAPVKNSVTGTFFLQYSYYLRRQFFRWCHFTICKGQSCRSSLRYRRLQDVNEHFKSG